MLQKVLALLNCLRMPFEFCQYTIAKNDKMQFMENNEYDNNGELKKKPARDCKKNNSNMQPKEKISHIP